MCQILSYTRHFDYLDQIAQKAYVWYTIGQNIVHKFTKLSKLGDFLECFTADFFQLPITTVKNWPLGSCLGTSHQCQAFEGSF